jgi:hypothetical protein
MLIRNIRVVGDTYKITLGECGHRIELNNDEITTIILLLVNDKTKDIRGLRNLELLIEKQISYEFQLNRTKMKNKQYNDACSCLIL